MIATGKLIDGSIPQLTDNQLALDYVLNEYFTEGHEKAHSREWIETDFPFKNPKDGSINPTGSVDRQRRHTRYRGFHGA